MNGIGLRCKCIFEILRKYRKKRLTKSGDGCKIIIVIVTVNSARKVVKHMKKLIVAVSAVICLCSAVFAETVTDNLDITWSLPEGTYKNINISVDETTGSTVFAFPDETSYLYVLDGKINGDPWLYNSNDVLSLSVVGFRGMKTYSATNQMILGMISAPVTIDFHTTDGVVYSGTTANIPFSAFISTTGYSFTDATAVVNDTNFAITWKDGKAPAMGAVINDITLNLPDELANSFLTSNGGMRKMLVGRTGPLQITGTTLTREKVVDIPEPASFAYGIMGIVSLLGIKSRIKK